jgi:hypothetical protein
MKTPVRIAGFHAEIKPPEYEELLVTRTQGSISDSSSRFRADVSEKKPSLR